MMLRRLKEDVEKNLAPKQETIIEVGLKLSLWEGKIILKFIYVDLQTLSSQVELTDIQKKYYRAILERNFSFLSLGANSNSNVPNLLNTMMELRKCCNHPYLINGKSVLKYVYSIHNTNDLETFYKVSSSPLP